MLKTGFVSLITLIVFSTTATVANERFKVEELASELNYPWSMTFLPDGDLLVTEKPGGLVRINLASGVKTDIAGIPEVYFVGQGGMLEVMLDSQFSINRTVYLSYSAGSADSNHLKVISAKLVDNTLQQQSEILITQPARDTAVHYGARMTQTDDSLFIAVGDGFSYRDQAQSLDNHYGKILKVHKDGTIPKDNPFLAESDALDEIYTLGHRNPQAILIDDKGQIWSNEHGPKGGDELNLIEAGKNYGWPAITYGSDYTGAMISPYQTADGMQQPVTYWTPSIASAGMTYYQGDKFPQWQGNIFLANLAERSLRRLILKDNQVIEQETMLQQRNQRLRDVRSGPDGYIYILTDAEQGKLLRLIPE